MFRSLTRLFLIAEAVTSPNVTLFVPSKANPPPLLSWYELVIVPPEDAYEDDNPSKA
jgi:hypothetical protein